MDRNLENMDSGALQGLYEKHLQQLSNALLNGAEWKDVQDQRKFLIELSKRMHRGHSGSPAEHPQRQE